MWFGLLSRFWPWLAAVVALIGGALYLNHAGYKSGYAASEARWQRSFVAAEQARDAANARAALQEAASSALSQKTEAEHAQTVASLALRAAAADKRLRVLGVRLSAARTSCQSVPETPGSPAVPDAATESEQRASEAGGRIAATGADCELDAAAKVEWQRFYIELRSTINREN